ncbi:MAG TPA: hypothetical protein VN767_07830 [Streptosporangiaceae bacterium]|nr:hypothetical protein [Streptosporangiaceae bacterium]
MTRVSTPGLIESQVPAAAYGSSKAALTGPTGTYLDAQGRCPGNQPPLQ